MVVEMRTRVSQVTPESPGIPRAVVYGLCRDLPGDRAFLSPSPAGISSRRLDASVEASGPHDFAVRKLSALVFSAARVHRIPPRVRDDREPPLCGTGQGELWGDLGILEIRIFLQKGLDRGVDQLRRWFARRVGSAAPPPLPGPPRTGIKSSA